MVIWTAGQACRESADESHHIKYEGQTDPGFC